MAKKTDKVSLRYEEEKKTKKEQAETEKAKGAKRKKKAEATKIRCHKLTIHNGIHFQTTLRGNLSLDSFNSIH